MIENVNFKLNLFTKAFVNNTPIIANSPRIITNGKIAIFSNYSTPLLSVEKSEYFILFLLALSPYKIVNKVPKPYPTNILKRGPAIVAVIAISPNPFFVKAKSALTSPRLFPHESTVKERSAYGSVVIKPKSLSKSTTQLDVKLTHAILIIKAKNAKNIYAFSGGAVLLVQKNI